MAHTYTQSWGHPQPAQLFTPPLTPETSVVFQQSSIQANASRYHRTMTKDPASPSSLTSSPDFIALPPAMTVPELDLDDTTPTQEDYITLGQQDEGKTASADADEEKYTWHDGMTAHQKDAREAWLAGGKGRKGLRIVIVTENFLPKVDGVTRTLARLLEHLTLAGHQCMLLGPSSTMSYYASHPLVGTLGIPLVIYPGLKLNFLRPKFLRVIKDFQPDIVHFVDPIWLGPQTMAAMELGWAGEEWVGQDGPALGGGMGGAVVASYHTNLATYATLFGLSWLTPVMWRFQRFLYSKTLLTLCPSPSTKSMLESQGFGGVRLWPRGVDLAHFAPRQRSMALRATWGVGDAPCGSKNKQKAAVAAGAGVHWQGRKASLPLSPPLSPYTGPISPSVSRAAPESSSTSTLPERVVLLYTGRISWEKNLSLLLSAYSYLPQLLSQGTLMPKLVFTGDGPARTALEERCAKEGWDAVFAGHRSGQELAEHYASADVFAFPSFTETFGQVVLEALASGLPVVGLDAEGTRDLVSHDKTGLLLALPPSSAAKSTSNLGWATICQPDSPDFQPLAKGYAELLARVVADHESRRSMGKRASTEGIKGYTWWDAMEQCVDGYREALRISRCSREIEVVPHPSPVSDSQESVPTPTATASPSGRKVSIVNRVVSRRLAHKGSWAETTATAMATTTGVDHVEKRRIWRRKVDTAESIWHLKTLLKALIVFALFYGVYTRHISSQRSKVSVFEMET